MTRRDHDHDLLTRALHDRAGDMTGASLGLDDVKGRARSIRRRRQALTGVVAAAVMAIAVPVGLTVGDVDRGSEPLPTTPSPGLTDGPTVDTATPEPDGPIPADGPSAPRGPDPALSYLVGSVLRQEGEGDVELGRELDAFTRYGEGWIGFDLGAGERGTTYRFGADGREQESLPGAGLGVSTDRSWLVYQLEALAAGATDLNLAPTDRSDTPLTHTVALGETVQPVGFGGDREFVYTLTDQQGNGSVWVTDFLRDERQVPGIINASGANDARGLVSGQISFSDTGSCWAVVDLATGRQVWDTCDFALRKFSPDGSYVIGTDAYADGLGGSQTAILDAATGQVLAEFTTRDLGFITQPVWESDSAVLMPTYQDGTWYLLRLGPDGSVERAADPVSGSEMRQPWILEVTP